MRRIKPLSDRALLSAAHLLLALAGASENEDIRDRLSILAYQLAEWALREGLGPVASQGQCMTTLKSLQKRWEGNIALQPALDILGQFSLDEVAAASQLYIAQRKKLMRYRASDGTERLGPRLGGKARTDDLSERIWIAREALKQAGCNSPLVTIAEILNSANIANANWTPPRVAERLKPIKLTALPPWPECFWLLRFWTQCCQPDRISIPHQQPFVLKWHPEERPRKSTHHRVAKPG